MAVVSRFTYATICAEVKKPKMKPLLVGSWYRASDLSVEIFDHFDIFLQNIEHENRDIILTGDLNCNLLSTETNRKIEKLQDLMCRYQLKQHITTPTRIINDIIITKIDDTKTIKSGVTHLGISDHSLVYICRTRNTCMQQPLATKSMQLYFRIYMKYFYRLIIIIIYSLK